MTVNGTIVEPLEPLLGLCLGGCSPVELRYAVAQHVRLWMPLLKRWDIFPRLRQTDSSPVEDVFWNEAWAQRHLFPAPHKKKSVCSEHTGLSMVTSMLWQTLILAFANHQLKCQHKYYNVIFKVYSFCGCLYSISAANWLWLHKPALFQYRITGNIFIIYWIATLCLLVFHRLLRSAIYFFDSLENFMHNE